jgi:class 3 adenylate cyclase
LNKLSTIELKKISQNEDYIPFFKTLEFDDGFIGIKCNTNAIYEAANGVVWIGANDILAAYDPKIDVDSVPPNIQLTCIKLFNENVEWINLANKKDSVFTLSNGAVVSNYKFDSLTKWYFLPQNLSLAYDNSYLTFNFIGITQSSPKKVKYQYKLEGLDKNWSITTSNTEASYANLPHGTYTFKVKAMNSEGVWSKPFEYTFTIRPPWWRTWWAYSIYFITLVGSVWYYIKWRERALKQRQIELENTVALRTAEVVEEKNRNEELLLNILPREVAEELKYKGEAEARQIDEVTVLFTDFKGFTSLSEKLSPKELVQEIHACFSAFDIIMQKHGVEKIKTIGDAYMAAGGLPVPNKSHAGDVVSAALEIQKYMEQHKIEKQASGELFFEIRIGVHTGPVVAGIVGVKKFAYDIWGDTVNTASRMESSGEVGKVNISGATYEKVKDQFLFIPRGKIQAKGKGEVDMYFVLEKTIL